MAVLLTLPSFTLWTSIASEESIVVFALAVLGGYFLRIYYRRDRLTFLPILAAVILYIWKQHYFVAVSFAIFTVKACQFTSKKALLALGSGMASLGGLFLFRDRVDELAFTVQWALNFGRASSRSSRLEDFFVDQYDVFLKAPLGMFQSFVGPKLSEAAISPLHMAALIETVALLAFFGYYLIMKLPRLPAHNAIMGVFVAFWISFPNYPFGVMNPGAAIRYRSGWIVFVFVAFVLLTSRELYMRWTDRSRVRTNVGRRP